MVALERDDDLGPLPALVSLTAYRIVQEGLTNARKHGGAQVDVALRKRPGGIQVEVADGGRTGAPMVTAGPGHGLTGMRERVAAVGGSLVAGPEPDGGYRIVAWLPTEGAHT